MLNFIVNPKARRGTGVEEVKIATSRLDELKIPYTLTYTEYSKHATEIASELTLAGTDTIVSCGGDGTIHEIINGILSARDTLLAEGKPYITKLALLPCGTGNDFMRSAGIPIKTLAALDVILNGRAAPIDAIRVGDIYEICFACRGIDIDVVNLVNASKNKSPSSYLKKLLICVLRRINYDFRLIIDGEVISSKGLIATVLNGGKIASGMNVCPSASPNDGLLDVVFVKKMPPLRALFALARITGDNFIDNKNVLHYTARSVVIETSQSQIDVDGELYDNKKFDASIAPNVLNLIR